jgi:chain length determinant protein tyrosine kinase EpsG
MDITPPNKLRPVADSRIEADRHIGRLLVAEGKLTLEDAEKVLRLQREKGLRFGQAARQLGLISEEDLRHALSTQFNYPYLREPDPAISQELTAAYRPFVPQVEQFRALRSDLMLRWFDQNRRCLAVIGPAHKSGRSFLTANLAIVFSQLGQKTLLVDADMRAPRQHKLFGLDQQTGLSHVLSGRAETPPIRRVPVFVDLSILPAGPTPPNPQELLMQPRFASILEEAAETYDVVLIDTPASESAADAITIAVRAGGAVVVARQNRTKTNELQTLCSSVTAHGGQVVGTIFNTY